MSIVFNSYDRTDIDLIILSFARVTYDYINILYVNRYYYDLVSNHSMFKSWKRVVSQCMSAHDYLTFDDDDHIGYDDMLFILACRKDMIIRKPLIAERPHINIHACSETIFSTACSDGNLELAKWLIEIDTNDSFGIFESDENMVLSTINSNNKLTEFLLDTEEAHKYYKMNHNSIENLNEIFGKLVQSCCKNGGIDLLKKIIDIVHQYGINLNTDSSLDHGFISCCVRGRIAMAQVILEESGTIRIDSEDFKCIIESIKYCKHAMTKWLINLCIKDKNKYGNIKQLNIIECIKAACVNDNLGVLDALFKLDIDTCGNSLKVSGCLDIPFQNCCRYGYLRMIDKLWEFNSANKYSLIDIHADDENAFVLACKNNNICVVKWLLEISRNKSIGYINIHVSSDKALKYCLNHRLYALIDLLVNLCNDSRYGTLTDTFK